MKGNYHVEVRAGKVQYKFDVRRKFTIVRGNSGTGKTNLIDEIYQYLHVKNSFVVVRCDAPVDVLTIYNMEYLPGNVKPGSIVFMDEEVVKELDHTGAIDKLLSMDNYFVMVTRRKLAQIPYSISEIYELKNAGKLQIAKREYTETVFHALYQEQSDKIRPDLIVTEDSGSGFDFFQNTAKCECVSAEGNSNIEAVLRRMVRQNKVICAIVDGAAFGPYIDSVKKMLDITGSPIYILAPESFEWIILRSRLYYEDSRDYIERTCDYCDAAQFNSWEQFYYELLVKLSENDSYRRYSKKKLAEYYVVSRESIYDVLPEIDKSIII